MIRKPTVVEGVLDIGDLVLVSGQILQHVQIQYEAYGSFRPDPSNAILVCHALTGDAHAYMGDTGPGWWDGLIGPGKALDPNRHFIVSTNVIGGCSGSTGPESINPATGRPYAGDFPEIQIRDMVQAQKQFLDLLGISHLKAVIGGSMGGMQVMEWASMFPEMSDSYIPIASCSRFSALGIAFNHTMRQAITNDPNWKNGNYLPGQEPVEGLSLARKIGMITYRSFDLFEQRFGRERVSEVATVDTGEFQMVRYLQYQGHKFVDRFDARSYLTLLRAMDLHDITAGRKDDVYSNMRGRFLFIGVDTDLVYPTSDIKKMVDSLRENQHVSVEYREMQTIHGHDAFLIEFEQMNMWVGEFLERGKQMAEQSRKIRIGLLGLGTVGAGVVKTLHNNRRQIVDSTGYEVEIARILVRNPLRERIVDVPTALLTTNPDDILLDESISVVVEVMGGIDPTYEYLVRALMEKKRVVTANKELLAKYGEELFGLAEQHGVQIMFEASVGGGIPVIHLLQEYLTVNRIDKVSGILNGTCNYILTEMEQDGRSYQEVLSEAQAKGYAEADPTSDVEGFDTAYKLAILTRLAFQAHVPVGTINRTGITEIITEDLQMAKTFGYTLKLIGSAEKQGDSLQLSVGPQLLPLHHPLARVNGVFNAVAISGDVVGDLTFIGRGAGELPTASAVTEDLVALLRNTGSQQLVKKKTIHKDSQVPLTNNRRSEGIYIRFSCLQRGIGRLQRQLSRFAIAEGGRVVATTETSTQVVALYGSDEDTITASALISGVSEEQVRSFFGRLTEDQDFLGNVLMIPVLDEALTRVSESEIPSQILS